MRKYNKFEKENLFNTWLISGVILLGIVINLTLPVFGAVIGYMSPTQWIIVLAVYILAFIYSQGFLLGQHVPVMQLILIRLIQVAWHMFVSDDAIKWSFYGIMLGVDILLIYLLYMDKTNYQYIEVREEEI